MAAVLIYIFASVNRHVSGSSSYYKTDIFFVVVYALEISTKKYNITNTKA